MKGSIFVTFLLHFYFDQIIENYTLEVVFLRIISGTYRGLQLKGFDIEGTRPTMDRVKESMFAMIQSNIKDSVVLDLFAGSGNLGIEAMSNGSKAVYFVDSNRIATKTITENLDKIHVTEEYHILEMDYKKALKEFQARGIKFDIVLLDPPYRLHFIHQILKRLVEYELLNPNALVVCEYDKEEISSDILTCIKEKRYGDKYVKIYKNK